MITEYLKDDGEFIFFNGDYMEMYIPSSYFENSLAENYGSAINVFGVFNVRTFNAKNTPGKLETLNVPTFITIYPSDNETKELQLVDGENGDLISYNVAKFYKGNKIMSNSVPQDSNNVEVFLNLLCRGKLPNTIPYSQVLSIWQKNLMLNNVKLGVTSTVLEIVITEVYRNKKNPQETFAKYIGKNPDASEFSYKTANMREICSRNSTFAGLTFEDMDSMLTTSLNINKYKKSETESPIEKIIKM